MAMGMSKGFVRRAMLTEGQAKLPPGFAWDFCGAEMPPEHLRRFVGALHGREGR